MGEEDGPRRELGDPFLNYWDFGDGCCEILAVMSEFLSRETGWVVMSC